MSVRNDLSERLFYVLETAVRYGLTDRETAQRAYAAAVFLSGCDRFVPLFEKLGRVTDYPKVKSTLPPGATRRVRVPR